jgi:hypothetical protein
MRCLYWQQALRPACVSSSDGGGGNSGRNGVWPTYFGDDDSAGNPPNQSGPDWCMTQPPVGMTCNSTLSIPGFESALALFIQNDNRGPPTVAQIQHYYEVLGRMFPNATLVSSTYEAFFAELDTIRESLPVVTMEIGDTWIDDPPSDPVLAARFRALMRARSQCVRDHPAVCNNTDTGPPEEKMTAFYNFSRFLAKVIAMPSAFLTATCLIVHPITPKPCYRTSSTTGAPTGVRLRSGPTRLSPSRQRTAAPTWHRQARAVQLSRGATSAFGARISHWKRCSRQILTQQASTRC